MAKQRKPKKRPLGGRDLLVNNLVEPPVHPEAHALLDEFLQATPYELHVMWGDGSPVTCVYLRANDVVLELDHLLRRPHHYPLPPPMNGLYSVDWGLTPELPITGVLLLGIVNRETNATVIVDSIKDPKRVEWSDAKVVDAP